MMRAAVACPHQGRAAMQDSSPSAPTHASPFVGRVAELAELGAAFERAIVGDGQIVLLAGEPGIGKTRLAEELALTGRERGALVLWGRCTEWEGAPPYWPWVQLLRSALRGRDAAALRADLGHGTVEIAQLVPKLRERLPDIPDPPPLEPEAARFRLFDAVTTYLKTLAERQPLVLVLDDLHWGDAPSLLLLQFLAQDLRATPILLLGAYRNVEVGRQHPLAATLAELAREPSCQRLMLRGLGYDDVARYLALTSGAEASSEFVTTVERETEGNPFFVTEVVRWLAAEGRLADHAHRRAVALGIPESIREVIGRRLDRLSAAANQVLSLAAVAGREFDVALLVPISSLAAHEVIDALEEPLQAGIIEEAGALGRYRFSHALIQETLYHELRTPQRVRLHQQFGEALEQLYADQLAAHYDELAHHFFQAASAGSVDRAIDYAVNAAEHAMEQVAWEAAAEHYQRALQCCDLTQPADEVLRCELLLALGTAQWNVGDVNDARASDWQAVAIARRLNLPEHFARAAFGYAGGEVFGFGFVDQPTIQVLEDALAAVPATDSLLRVKLLCQLACFLHIANYGHLNERLDLAELATAISARLGDSTAQMLAAYTRWVVHAGPDAVQERWEALDAFMTLAVQVGSHAVLVIGLWNRSLAWLECGDLEAADRDAVQFIHIGEQMPWRTVRWGTLSYRAMRAIMEGRYGAAEDLIERAIPLGRHLWPTDPNPIDDYTAQQLAMLRREQGRLAELEPSISERIGLDDEFRAHWQCWKAIVEYETGHIDRARASFDQVVTQQLLRYPRKEFWLSVMTLSAELAALMDDTARADTLYELLRPLAGRTVHADIQWVYWGPLSYYLGLLATTLARWDAASAHLDDALAMNARMEARPLVAHTQYAYADMLRRRASPGDDARARGLLDQSLFTARDLGMVRLERMATSLQESLAMASATATRTCQRDTLPFGLSAREVEVLRLIAAGYSDRQIAEALFISPRTVGAHVTNILGKLGVHTRAEAAAQGVRAGLA